ncbi:YbaB/EbfC family nucleoid-associated protein [Candidatus Saccharibacteria bacterium]|jgi:DNA-binding YbaB/EbfC family protein|nr:YbaB/EbfC family nucleoid-associated protein [Candidatus Saccharibacteria bacterium]MBP9132140.1 YbaB/EbfC family nucleoid-associated protein [Candidatus Saccharibacteria bacterium]
MMDQVKMMAKMKKIQKELSKTIVEVEAGEGAVTIQMNGEQKIKDVSLDTELIDFDDIGELETWIEQAFKKAIAESQKVAQEKMQPIMGQLGNLGL